MLVVLAMLAIFAGCLVDRLCVALHERLSTLWTKIEDRFEFTSPNNVRKMRP